MVYFTRLDMDQAEKQNTAFDAKHGTASGVFMSSSNKKSWKS
jgi:hypothetical protein